VTLLFTLHFAATLFMTGVIWVVQVLHYPMLGRSGNAFDECQAFHLAKTGWVVGPPMLVEGITGAVLLWQNWRVPMLWAASALLCVIWISTAFLQVPRHNELARGWDARAHAGLVRTNWIRTAAWTARAAVLILLASGDF
jgi:hypothetical protein